MKTTKQELKSIIKECIKEVLKEERVVEALSEAVVKKVGRTVQQSKTQPQPSVALNEQVESKVRQISQQVGGKNSGAIEKLLRDTLMEKMSGEDNEDSLLENALQENVSSSNNRWAELAFNTQARMLPDLT
jgi:hypothetical protein